jgi:hypothetical protein
MPLTSFLFSTISPHPKKKKKASILNVQSSHAREVGHVILFFMLCISELTLIKITLYLKKDYMHYVGAKPSKMATKTT